VHSLLLWYWNKRGHQKGRISIEEIRERKVLGAFMPNFLPDDIEQAEIGNGGMVLWFHMSSLKSNSSRCRKTQATSVLGSVYFKLVVENNFVWFI
jgi:hypothetical protein